MKKKTKDLVAVVVIASAVIITVLAFVHNQSFDKCSETDRQQNNCVPAGRCTPPGDPREATIDCNIKNYDHKFSR